MRAPAPPYRGEGPHALWHVSEDPDLEHFAPRLFESAVRMPEGTFVESADTAGYWISREPVDAIGRLQIDDLVGRHRAARIDLRVVPNLWPLWDEVVGSTLEFSGMRLRNALARP
jgi:hypothetical protein